MNYFRNLLGHRIISLHDLSEIAQQANPESPHSEVKEQPQRDDDGRNDVQPLVLEGTRVGLYSQHGIIVQLTQECPVPRVREVFYHSLKLITDAFHLVVGLVS